MEQMHPVTDSGLAAWCDVWNDGSRLLPRAPADLRHEARMLGLCERFALGPPARLHAVATLRRHFAFRQDTRLALDLHVRPSLRGLGLGGSLLAQLLVRARALGAEVIRAYAPADDPAWAALALRHSLQLVECDRYFLLHVDCAITTSSAAIPACTLAQEPAATEREAWQLEQLLHAGLDTSAPYVPETFERWRSRVLEAPGSSAETVLVTRAPGGALAGICALRVCSADSGTLYHAFTGVAEAARGQGHGLALKLAAIDLARRLGARRMVADTSPGNDAMLRLNERLGYVAVLDVRNLEGIV